MRFLLQRLIEHLEFVRSQLTRLEQEIAERPRPFEEAVRHPRTVLRIHHQQFKLPRGEGGLPPKKFPGPHSYTGSNRTELKPPLRIAAGPANLT